jgi:hypothetical protein
MNSSFFFLDNLYNDEWTYSALADNIPKYSNLVSQETFLLVLNAESTYLFKLAPQIKETQLEGFYFKSNETD